MSAYPRWSVWLAGVAMLATVAGCADDSNVAPATPTVAEQAAGSQSEGSALPEAGAATHSESRQHGRPDSVHWEEGHPPGDADAAEPADADQLGEDDMAGLLWMREEEQLAHDVYAVLGQEFGLRVFDKISSSERRHVERVVGLLARYGIEDPMTYRPAGTFTIPEMQTAFDDLVADGRTSLVDALEAGALIEETDIADLRARSTDVAVIQEAYERLEQGSHRHLRAFVSQLAARDVTYEPAVLDVDAFDEIVSDG